MDKRGIVLDLIGFKVFESVPTKFGNGAHVLISKKYSEQKIKILVGKPTKIKKNKIELDFFGNEILERKPKRFGTSFHITLPKEHLGKKIKLIAGKENE